MKNWRELVVSLLIATGVAAGIYFIPRNLSFTPVDQPSGVRGSDRIERELPIKKYGIPVSSYEIFTGKVRRGESLAELLLPHGISMQQIFAVSPASRYSY